jgi:hypothetical protein
MIDFPHHSKSSHITMRELYRKRTSACGDFIDGKSPFVMPIEPVGQPVLAKAPEVK